MLRLTAIEGLDKFADKVKDFANRTGNNFPFLSIIAAKAWKVQIDHFDKQASPDGEPWHSLSQTTLDNRRHGKASGSPRILEDSGKLRSSIKYRVLKNAAEVYTNVVYAGTQQFGANKGAFGNYKGHAIPWGSIPARPFIGLSDAEVEDYEQAYLYYITEGKLK